MPDLIAPADPHAFYHAYREEIDQAMIDTMRAGSYILGPETDAFEQEFAAWLTVPRAIACGNGTDALALALRLAGVGPDATVITVSHTAVATVAAIGLVGAVPLLLDIEPNRYGMDWVELEEVLRNPPVGLPPVKAVIVVHLYGHPADIDAIGPLCARYAVAMIEDCAQAHGARLGGQMVGTFATRSAFSFYPTKNLGALGDAGALVCLDPEEAARAAALRQYGWRQHGLSAEAGVNSRLDAVQAAILRIGLRHLDARNTRRQQIASFYDDVLLEKGLSPPARRDDAAHVFHQYVIRTTARPPLQARLRELGIGTAIHYAVPVHLQPAYRDRIALGPAGCRETALASDEVLSLPVFPEMSDGNVDRVREALRRI